MAWPENPKAYESPEKIPVGIAQEVDALVELLPPEPLSVDQILLDFWINNTESKETEYLKDVVEWLNRKMEKLNLDAKNKVKNLPDYFKNTCTDQMNMEWSGVWGKYYLTIISQGQEVMKFEIWVNINNAVDSWLWIYMKDLFTEKQESDGNDINPDDFLEFATGDDARGWDRWLYTFDQMYTENFGRPAKNRTASYMNYYVKNKDTVIQSTSTTWILLLPQQETYLINTAFNGQSVTINNIFWDPKPSHVEITYPNGSKIMWFFKNWGYVDSNGIRPKIRNWCKVKNTMPPLEIVQWLIEREVMNQGYRREELFPYFSNFSPAYQQAIKEYMSLFINKEIRLQNNDNWLSSYVDVNSQWYCFHYELDNQYGNRPYNKSLTIQLDGAVTGLLIDKDSFRNKLADDVAGIIQKNFLTIARMKGWVTLTTEDFSTTKSQDDISACPKWQYQIRNSAWKVMTFCSTAAQDSARNNFWITIPNGNALVALNKEPIDLVHYKAEYKPDEWKKTTDLWATGMYELLSKYLSSWCTVVDIWYDSTATANGRKYGHRNIAYYCYDTKEWYVLDPVSSFWGVATSKPRQLRDTLSDKYTPVHMRYYTPDVGVYEKDPGPEKTIV